MNIKLFFAGVGVSAAAALFAAVDPGHQNFHNVAVTSAAQNRTDWRVNSFDWTTAESLGEGVDYLPLKLTTAGGWDRTMVCHLIRVDTSKPNVRFTGIDRCVGWGEPTKEGSSYKKCTVLEKTGDLMARYRGAKAKGGKARDMRVAMNTQGWSPWPGDGSGFGQIGNLCITDGNQVSLAASGKSGYCPGVLVVYKDGSMDVVDSVPAADVPRIWYACTPTFCRLMTDGEIAVKHYKNNDGKEPYVDYSDNTLRPRTAIGISQDKRYFFGLVVDGDNNSWSGGAKPSDLAKIMKQAGCWQALDLDGGGSSNMVGWDDANNRPMMLGRPGGSFGTSAQRDGGCHAGIYLAPILAKVGTYRYDDADVLVQDIADGETPSGVREVDVLGTLVFSAGKPTLPSGADFTFSSTNGATLAWEGGRGQVAAGTRVGFRGVRFAEGSRTLAVAAGGRAVVGSGTGLERIETADADGFVLGGALDRRLTVDCAAARTAGTVFGTSALSLAETCRVATNLVSATSDGLCVAANERNGRVELSWSVITLAPASVKVKKDDETAVVSVDVMAVAAAYAGGGNRLALTVTSDDGTSTNVVTEAMNGTGRYAFQVSGSGFGYSYGIQLVDAQGTPVAGAAAQAGVFTFGIESVWFAAEPPQGAVTGGRWTADGVFAADEGGKSGKVRVVTEVCLDTEEAGSGEEAGRLLQKLRTEGVPQAAFFLQRDGNFAFSWRGLVAKDGAPAWERLYGVTVPDGVNRSHVLIEEVDFSSGRPRVRYFAGLKESGAATLLADASGATAFDGAGEAASVDGIVTFASCGTIASLRGFSRVKDPKGNGFLLQLVCR